MKEKALLARMKRLEQKVQDLEDRTGPVDIYGEYYDTLDDGDKWRWWRYCYAGDCPFDTLSECEAYELRTIRDSLHFQCERIQSLDDILDFPELDDLEIRMKRRDFLEV